MMKVTAVLLSFVMVFTFVAGAFPISVSAGSSLIGDVDKDGKLTVSDALSALRVSAAMADYDPSELEVYDVWQDGAVGVDDALGILRSSVGLIGSFGRTGVEFKFTPNEKATSAGVTQEMLNNAIVSIDGTSRIAKVMDKAAAGEDISIVTLGGSITAGSSAGATDNRYANIISSWWSASFPAAKVTLQNSGIGATGSILGVHRLERDVYAYEPDLLVVEFAVNDNDNEMTGNAESYENLIRRVLTESPDTAIIMLFMTAKNYTDSQALQIPIGEHYEVPMISFRNALRSEIESGRFTWDGIIPDGIHPNTQGHAIAGSLVTSYLDGVKAVYCDSTRIIPAVPSNMLTSDKYMKAKLNWAGEDITPVSLGSWKLDEYVFNDYVGSWCLRSGRQPLVIEAEFKNLMFLYEGIVNESASGRVKIYVDDAGPIYLSSYYENGWGNSLIMSHIYTADTYGKHTIKVIPNTGKFRLAAILTA